MFTKSQAEYFAFNPLAGCVNHVSDQSWLTAVKLLDSIAERHRTAVTSSLLFDWELRNLHNHGGLLVLLFGLKLIKPLLHKRAHQYTGVAWLLGLDATGSGVDSISAILGCGQVLGFRFGPLLGLGWLPAASSSRRMMRMMRMIRMMMIIIFGCLYSKDRP